MHILEGKKPPWVNQVHEQFWDPCKISSSCSLVIWGRDSLQVISDRRSMFEESRNNLGSHLAFTNFLFRKWRVDKISIYLLIEAMMLTNQLWWLIWEHKLSQSYSYIPLTWLIDFQFSINSLSIFPYMGSRINERGRYFFLGICLKDINNIST